MVSETTIYVIFTLHASRFTLHASRFTLHAWTRYAIISFFLLLIFPKLFSQTPLQANDKYIQSTVPTPEAASLGKFTEIPVSNSSGVPSISIPIHTLAEGSIQVPISLNYHAGGMKVQEVSSWVGAGWNLTAGGMINRTVVGAADDDTEKKGLYYNTLTNQIPNRTDITAGVGELVDNEPDVFTYSFGGYSGKFYFDKNVTGEVRVKQVPMTDLKIEVQTGDDQNFSGFIVTTTNGMRYIFGKLPNANNSLTGGPSKMSDIAGEKTIVTSNIFGEANANEDNGFKPNFFSTWYLVRIETHDGSNKVDFEYVEEKFSYRINRSDIRAFRRCGTYISGIFINGAEFATFLNCDNSGPSEISTYVVGKKISRITTNTEIVDFISNTDRKDVSIWRSSPSSRGKVLDEIKITSKNNSYCRKFVLTHEYFNDTPTNIDKPNEKRLMLRSVQEKSCDNSIQKGEFRLTYKQETSVGTRLTYAIDHWGYLNGKYSNDAQTTKLPKVRVNWLATDIQTGNQDNESNFTFAQYGALDKISYPTGGYTSFEFENNQVTNYSANNGLVGGLRVKTTSFYPSASETPIVKNYEYSNGILVNSLNYTHTEYLGNTAATCDFFIISQSNLVAMSSFDDNYIIYKNVTVSQTNNGKSVYEYEGNAAVVDITQYPRIPAKYAPRNGSLLKETHYDKDNVKKSQTINQYKQDPLIASSGQFIKAEALSNCECTGTPSNTGFFGKKYSLYTSLNRIETQTNELDGVITTTNYTYDDQNRFLTPKTVITTNSEGKIYRTNNVYVHELSSTGNSSTSSGDVYMTPNLRSEMIKRNIISMPIITTVGITNNIANLVSDDKIISGQINGYNFFSKSTGLVSSTITDPIYPEKFYEYLYPLNSIAAKWRLKGTIMAYELVTLKPSEFRADGWTTSHLYKWYQHGAVKEKSFGGLVWKYNLYDKTGLISLITDENGLRTKFTYDSLARLYKTQNRFSGLVEDPQDIQATTTYDYHYKNSPTDYNYVGTTTAFKGVTDPLSTKQYLDGLGRPIEVVKELYTPPTANHSAYWHQKNYVTYDVFGRQNISYLPFETGTLGFEAPANLLNSAGYVETGYESSPLSRPINQRNPDGKYTYMSYESNIATDAVQVFTTTSGANALISATSSTTYAPNTLYKTTSTDENGKKACVFKDKLGRVILTRKFLNGASGQNVDTYNVYDDYGQLVAVLPPGSVVMSGSVASVINDLTFQYQYDNQNRLIEKKIPGAESQKFYYNNRDLLTLTQDGNMRNPLYGGKVGRHLATQYDNLGRVVKTGWITTTDPITFAKNSFVIDNDTNKLTENIYYDNKSWIKHQGAKVLKPVGMGTLNSEFLWSYTERRVGLEYTGNPVWQGKQHLRYNGVSQSPILDSDIYGVDWVVSGYNGMQQPNLTIRYLFEGNGQEVRTWQDYTYDRGRRLTDVKYNYTMGGGISAPTYTLSNMVYNHKDQLIEKNIGLNGANTGALQSIDYTYNIRGWLTNINNVALYTGSTMSIMTPNMTGSATIQNLAISPFINLALQDAVKPYRAANAAEMPPINDNNMDLFSQNITYENPATQTGATPQYNGNISSTTWQVLGRAKQAYGFTYDGLDRLTEAKYFDITEQYTAPYTSIYNGIDKKYNESVTYDIRGNITSLQRYGLNDASWTQNGNPLVAGTFGLIDNLGYIYVKSSDVNNPMIKSNKLLQINDFSLPNKGFKANTTSRASANEEDYKYDDNGNLRYDRHKYITEITYNYLNLPKLIRFDNPLNRFNGSGKIEFVYDATGVKLRKIVTYHPDANRPVETYDYINGAEYKNTDLQRFAHTEGAIARNEFGAFEHEYVLRDHLGNARVTFRDGINLGEPYYQWDPNLLEEVQVYPNAGNMTGLNDGVITAADIKQVNHYYPFGLNMEGNWQGGAQGDNKYQYNEKQWNDDFGLGWNDYGARFYDPATGRWAAIDPMAQKFSYENPYCYAGNRPSKLIDIQGMFQFDPSFATQFPNVYKALITDGALARFGQRYSDVMVKNTRYYQANLLRSQGKSITGEKAEVLMDRMQNLSQADVATAFSDGTGPKIKLTSAPGSLSSANGYNHGDDGKNYTTPIELNIAAFQLYEDAIKKGDKKDMAAAVLNIYSTITNEFMEDFGQDNTDWGNGNFGGDQAQADIFYGLAPGILGVNNTVDSNFTTAKYVLVRYQQAADAAAKKAQEEKKKEKKN
jgi:RHS repeat-associated protein